jgi:hypothetical protein
MGATPSRFFPELEEKEAVVALATLAKVPLKVLDRLMGGDRSDPVLILCKAASLNWATVKAVILVRPDGADAGARSVVFQFQPTIDLHGAAGGPFLAAAARRLKARRSRSQIRFAGKSKNKTRARRAQPWPGSAWR